jgi:hypothetical protein
VEHIDEGIRIWGSVEVNIICCSLRTFQTLQEATQVIGMRSEILVTALWNPFSSLLFVKGKVISVEAVEVLRVARG